MAKQLRILLTREKITDKILEVLGKAKKASIELNAGIITILNLPQNVPDKEVKAVQAQVNATIAVMFPKREVKMIVVQNDQGFLAQWNEHVPKKFRKRRTTEYTLIKESRETAAARIAENKQREEEPAEH
jgi:hypothetical protein